VFQAAYLKVSTASVPGGRPEGQHCDRGGDLHAGRPTLASSVV